MAKGHVQYRDLVLHHTRLRCQAQVSGLGGARFALWHVPKHKAEARVGQVCISMSQMVLKVVSLTFSKSGPIVSHSVSSNKMGATTVTVKCGL